MMFVLYFLLRFGYSSIFPSASVFFIKRSVFVECVCGNMFISVVIWLFISMGFKQVMVMGVWFSAFYPICFDSLRGICMI